MGTFLRKSPGEPWLASTVKFHIDELLGKGSAANTSLRFLEGHSLMLPNLVPLLLARQSALEMMRVGSRCAQRMCFVHGDLHAGNIMLDSRDNNFLIDFGKTGLGHRLEDMTW